ncbi:MAG: DUF739 domain-containing protein [Clostridiales bacterium]|nr:DUF739 domain-containing protein [Clostridiales bacterium]
MNKNKLIAVMYEHGDTQASLAKSIGISLQTLNSKINEAHGAQFTQGEIRKIKERYSLKGSDVDLIFFTSNVSLEDT